MELNKENIKKIRGLILFTAIVLAAVLNYSVVLLIIIRLFKIILPFLTGGGIAFVLNVPMREIEKQFKSQKAEKWKRPLSLIITIILVLAVLAVVMFIVVPELFSTLWSLQESIPLFLADVQRKAEALFAKYPEIVIYIRNIQVDWNTATQKIMEFLSTGAGSVLSSTVSAAMSIVSGVTSFGIGFVFAVYILLQKEILASQGRKLITAYMKKKQADRLIYILKLTERTFSSFLAGQCLEAVILGAMFLITLAVLRMPYAILIGVLIAFTALIPMFGAFIGCGVGIFLMLMVNPVSALTFAVIFVVLQQIEGNFIYPHVVGNSVGLPSIWVLVAVTIGGSAMGIAGMLVFIPICSVIYALIRDGVNKRLANKGPEN